MSVDSISLPNLEVTALLARKIAPLLRAGDCIAMSGPLGAGKTEFARALLQTMGVDSDVPSPTFTLVQMYDVQGLAVSHFDLYRLKSADELDELGWDDALIDGVALVEWPERADGRLPADRLELVFELTADGGRSCVLKKHGSWATRL